MGDRLRCGGRGGGRGARAGKPKRFCMRLADYLNVFGVRVIMFPINHVLNGSPAEIEKAFKGLMDLIDTQHRGKGAQR